MSHQTMLPRPSSLLCFRSKRTAQYRSGSVVVLTAMMMVVLFAFLAFTVDLGYIRVVQSELQNAADGASLAAVNELPSGNTISALAAARQYANLNHSYSANPDSVLIGDANLETGMWDSSTRIFTPTNSNAANAARVTVSRNAGTGNPVSLFFARAIGTNEANVTAVAIATRTSDWQIVAGNKLQIGERSNLNGVSVYGRNGVEIGGNSKVLAGGKVGSLPDSVVQYEGIQGLPEKLVREDVKPWYADHVNEVIDDYKLGKNLPPEISSVSLLNAWPPSSGIANHTVYIVNGSVIIPSHQTISLHNIIIAALGDIQVGENSRVMNVGVPGNDINAGLFATGDIQIGQNAALVGVDMIAGHDIQLGQHLSALIVGMMQAANNIQLGQGPGVSGYKSLNGKVKLVQ